ncbi:MAG: PilZ domain-containing protein [Anaerolineae bacterium]|nr:PilZ domain-containing protein [Anaerolineae bacterium]MDK1118201.1 PilZ domain-containing protein [Anaerolineae bacterium]
MDERRNIERKDFSYYMRLINSETKDLLGHLTDLSSGGFKLDSPTPIETGKDFRLQMELTSEVADKPSMTFVARSKWCQVDPLDPFIYNVGFQMISIEPENMEIIIRMMDNYGKKHQDQRIDKRRSNLW